MPRPYATRMQKQVAVTSGSVPFAPNDPALAEDKRIEERLKWERGAETALVTADGSDLVDDERGDSVILIVDPSNQPSEVPGT